MQGATSSSGGGSSWGVFGTETFRVAPEVDSTIRVFEGGAVVDRRAAAPEEEAASRDG